MKHLYTDGTETVIAESERDADEVWSYATGDEHDSGKYPWELIPDEQPYTVLVDDEIKDKYLPAGAVIRPLGEDDEGTYPFTFSITAKAKAWANSNFCDDILCTTEY